MIDPLVLVVGIPVLWHLGLAGFAFYDAGRIGLSPPKWGLIALAVPLFGFLAYVFERSELDYDPAEDPYARGNTKAGFAVHESRQDESLLGPAEDDGDEEAVASVEPAHDEEDVLYQSPAARQADDEE